MRGDWNLELRMQNLELTIWDFRLSWPDPSTPLRSARDDKGGLDIDFVHKSWEGDALSDVLFAGEPGDGTFDAEAEAAVRDGAVFSQIEIPGVIFRIQSLLLDSF